MWENRFSHKFLDKEKCYYHFGRIYEKFKVHIL